MKASPFKKWILLLFCLLLLCGCGNKKEEALQRDELLAVNGNVCSWSEAQIFILAQKAIYSENYGEEIWAVQLPNGRFDSYIKNALLPYIELLFLADSAAEENGVRLSDGERLQVERAADAYLGKLGEMGREMTGIGREEIEDALTRYARGQIFYEQTLMDAKIEISEEEARVMAVQMVIIEERMGMATAQEIRQKLAGGSSVNAVLSEYVGCGAKKENIIRGDYGGDFDTIVFALKNEQWSPIISLNGQYYLVQCLSSYLPEETAKHKAQMEQEERETLLQGLLDEYGNKATLLLNPELWDAWKMEDFADVPAVNFYEYAEVFTK